MGFASPSIPDRSRVLYLGFAGLLLLMAAVAVDSGRSRREAEASNLKARLESRHRAALLNQLRLDIYRAATVVRDHLLETDDNLAATHKAELEALRERQNGAMAEYSRALPPAERDASHQQTLAKLAEGEAIYWQSLDLPLSWDAPTRRRLGPDYLIRVVIPRQSETVDLIRHITQLNRRDLEAGDEAIRAVEVGFRRRVTVVSIIAILIGSILAAFTIRRTQRLEAESEQRFAEVEAGRKELSRLSAQLVKAQEEERRKLSRELHDEIGQSMSAMLIELSRLESSLSGSAPGTETQRGRFASVREIAEDTVGMVRNMALLLRPSMLDDLGLLPALRWQAKEVHRRSGLNVQVVAEEMDEDPPEPVRTCLYRVTQEALHNCVRHAKADSVRVTLENDGSGLRLSIRDNGVGFNPYAEKGLGLLGMQERVESLGGGFLIESQMGAGTVVSLHFSAGSIAPSATGQSATGQSVTERQEVRQSL